MIQSFTQPEEFEVASAKNTIRNTMIATGCLLIVAGLLLWFLVGAALGLIGVKPPANQLIALVITVAVLALIVWARNVQLKRQLSNVKLVLDSTGVRQLDEWGNVRLLNWGDISGADPVKPLRKSASKAGGTPVADALAAGAQLMGSGLGLVGYGTIEFHGDNSSASHQAYADAFGRGPDGRQLVGVTPSMFDPNWQRGRIGEWLGHYRPDILEQARTRIESGGRDLGNPTGPTAPPSGD